MFFLILLLLFFNGTEYSFAKEKSLYISEINWAGSSSSSADEWLEIYNDSPADIDLSNYQISFLTSSGEKYITLTGSVKKYDYYLIANNSKDHIFSSGQSMLNIDPDLITPSLSLSNSNLLIKLLKSSDNGIDEIDIIGDGKDPYFGQTGIYRSMQRVGYNDGQNRNSFQSSNICINLDNCENNFGTPRAKNIFAPEINIINNQKNFLVDTDHLIKYNITFIGFDERYVEAILFYNGREIAGKRNQGNTIDFSINNSQSGCGKLLLMTKDEFGIQNNIENDICFYKKFNGLEISKILANSKNDQSEYVEMYNNSDEIIDLENYYIDDKNGGSKPYKLTNLIIFPKSSIRIDLKSKIALNDSGDEIRILDPNLNQLLNIPFARSDDGEVLCEENKFENCQTKYLPNVIINSILPYPEYGDEEEIVIKNLSKASTNLDGFYLKDKSDAKYTLKNINILPKSTLVLKQSDTKLNLNNIGQEILTLINPSGEILSALEYIDAKEGSRFYYQEGKYHWEENINTQIEKTNSVSQVDKELDKNDIFLTPIANDQINNDYHKINNYFPSDQSIKGIKNIDKATEKGYNSILIATILTIISLWKLYLIILMKV